MHDGSVDFQEGEAQSYDVYDIKIKLVIDRSVDALTVHSRARAPALTYARAYVRAYARAYARARAHHITSHHITLASHHVTSRHVMSHHVTSLTLSLTHSERWSQLSVATNNTELPAVLQRSISKLVLAEWKSELCPRARVRVVLCVFMCE